MGLELAFRFLANGFADSEETATEEAEEAEEVEEVDEAETQSEMAEAPGSVEEVAVEIEIGTKTVGSLETFRERSPWIGKKRQPPERPRPFSKYFLPPLAECLTMINSLNGQVWSVQMRCTSSI